MNGDVEMEREKERKKKKERVGNRLTLPSALPLTPPASFIKYNKYLI